MSDPYESVDPTVPTPSPAAPAPGYRSAVVQPRQVGFGEAVTRAFSGWGDYSSRSTVGEYWWYFLFEMLVGIPLSIMMLVAIVSSFRTSTAADGSPVVTSEGLSGPALVILFVLGVVYVLLFLVRLPLTVRRLHDTDRSGWWYFISAVPFGSIVLLVFLVGAGTPAPNRWGPVPQ